MRERTPRQAGHNPLVRAVTRQGGKAASLTSHTADGDTEVTAAFPPAPQEAPNATRSNQSTLVVTGNERLSER